MDKVEADVVSLLDSNGDGKLDEKDAHKLLSDTLKVLTCDTKLSAGGFSAGFLLGLRTG
jgi:hypothetical protein